MKKFITLIFLTGLTVNTYAGNLSAYFSFCTFDIPGQSPYLESYLNVVGNTVKFIPAENNFLKGQIEIQWIIKSGDKIVHVDKYNLISPNVKENDSLIPDFIDQQRLKLEKGTYDIELSIRDKNSNAKRNNIETKNQHRFPC